MSVVSIINLKSLHFQVILTLNMQHRAIDKTIVNVMAKPNICLHLLFNVSFEVLGNYKIIYHVNKSVNNSLVFKSDYII